MSGHSLLFYTYRDCGKSFKRDLQDAHMENSEPPVDKNDFGAYN
jgi:hypothetical protein